MAVVQTEAGPVRGVRDGRSWCWLGVPYAAAHTDARRLCPLAPPTLGAVVRLKAWAHRPVTPQSIEDGNGLNLGIWSPAVGERARAVLVWVHGGGFVGRPGNNYRGASLAVSGDIVVVTLKLRLGVSASVGLGSTLGDPAIASSLDNIAAALGWISRNIGGFGGDPGRVTVAGHAAGAVAVALLLRTPAAALFHGAILHGGSPDILHAAAPVPEGAGHPAASADMGDPLSKMPLMLGISPPQKGFHAGIAGRPGGTEDASAALDWRAFAEHRLNGTAPTWLYRFDYASAWFKTSPALLLLFLWPSPGFGPALARGGFLTGLRSGLSERLRAAWTGFVRDGNPGEDWPAYRLPERRIRLFDLQDRVVSAGVDDVRSG